MGKLRRGNYLFLTWVGNHPPRHVHVYRDAKLVAVWDLEGGRLLQGAADRRLKQLIAELAQEGRL